MQPRRSLLYMPGANARAMEKARDLPCDTVIFDLDLIGQSGQTSNCPVLLSPGRGQTDQGKGQSIVAS